MQEKVLYLEEMQSDWAKIGRNKGYRIEDRKEFVQAKETMGKIEKEFEARKCSISKIKRSYY